LFDLYCGDTHATKGCGSRYWKHIHPNLYSRELIYAIAGPEFGKNASLIFIVEKALYGLKTSGAEWHCKLADNLRSMGF
jgi:hypothetical protein